MFGSYLHNKSEFNPSTITTKQIEVILIVIRNQAKHALNHSKTISYFILHI